MIVYENPWFCVHKEGDFHFVDEPSSKNGAAVLPLIGDRLLLLEMRRKAQNDAITLEIPRGYGEKSETPLDCARRELLEETGYDAPETAFRQLGHMRPNTSLLTSRIALFSVQLDDIRPPRERDQEARGMMSVPLSDIPSMLSSGRIEDGFTLSALTYLAYCL